MGSREPFSVGEWYHCYNRGVDKRVVFETHEDYERFLKCLYLANSPEPFRLADIDHLHLQEILARGREEKYIGVGAFCLMPNHFHLLLRETTGTGVISFMHKLGTAYTMYFNKKRQRVGNLFVKPFRSRHVGDDIYFQHCVRYIHCNPAELFEHGWKQGDVADTAGLIRKLEAYPYSSFGIFNNLKHPLTPILDLSILEMVETATTAHIVRDALAYYAESSKFTR